MENEVGQPELQNSMFIKELKKEMMTFQEVESSWKTRVGQPELQNSMFIKEFKKEVRTF